MVTMNFLRMLVDASFFYAFAGFFAACYGGSGAFAGAAIQCLCFGLSSAAGERRGLRLALLLPMGLCWYWYRDSAADCILLLPVGIYIVLLAVKGGYVLDRDRQRQLFSVFWKVLLFFAAFVMVAGYSDQVTRVTLPYAVAMLAGSVLLMRSLRHDPWVYCQRWYQLLNLAGVALVAAAAWLMSSKAFLHGCGAALKAAYEHLLMPVAYLGLRILMVLLYGLSFLDLKPAEGSEPIKVGGGDTGALLTGEGAAGGGAQAVKSLIAVLLLLGVVLLVVLFFRWLNRARHDRAGNGGREEVRSGLPERRREGGRQEDSAVRGVRAQYRKFLKLCTGRGLTLKKSSTSLDVDRRARLLPGAGKVSGQIREIYIQARYAGKADKDSVQNMKKLYAEAKREAERKEP